MKNIYLLLIFLLSFITQAQNNSNMIIAFDSLIEASSSWKKYKLIENDEVIDFRKELVTMTGSIDAKVGELEKNVKEANLEINNLKKQNQDLDKELTALKSAKDEMSFLGLKMTKSSYSLMVWVIILVLLLILAFIIIKYRNRNIVTQELEENLKNTNKDFEEYKHIAIEKQQKLGRQLLDAQKKVQTKNRKSQ